MNRTKSAAGTLAAGTVQEEQKSARLQSRADTVILSKHSFPVWAGADTQRSVYLTYPVFRLHSDPLARLCTSFRRRIAPDAQRIIGIFYYYTAVFQKMQVQIKRFPFPCCGTAMAIANAVRRGKWHRLHHPRRHTQTDPKRTGDMRRRNPTLVLIKIAPEVLEKGLAAKGGSMPSLFPDAGISIAKVFRNFNSKEGRFLNFV